MKTTLRAFHNDPSIKDSLLARLRDDAAHGRIVERQDWEDREGCAVGGSDHMLYESEYGIPAVLAHIEDTIHEGLPESDRVTFPIRFIEAIPVGADLSRISWAFLHTILTDPVINPGITHELVRDAVSKCADLMRRLSLGKSVSDRTKSAVWSAAWSAAYSAWSFAEFAAECAAVKCAAYSAWSFAWSAAYSSDSAERTPLSADNAIRNAAYSAWSFAWSAAYSSDARELMDAGHAADSAKDASYQAMDRKLIELLGALIM